MAGDFMKQTKDLKFLIKIVKKASRLITEKFEINDKESIGNGDLITTYDCKVEEYLIKEIKKDYPNFDVVSEEFNTGNKLTENCFVIDPIDGTINFAYFLPIWGIQVACVRDGKTVAAVIYLPKLKEMYSADENGAYLNNKKIKVNALPAEKNIISATGKHHMESVLAAEHAYTLQRNFYCACFDFACVASGRLGGTIFTNNTLWDYIPGLFICEKAGALTHNENNAHIAANSEQLLEILKKAAIKTR